MEYSIRVGPVTRPATHQNVCLPTDHWSADRLYRNSPTNLLSHSVATTRYLWHDLRAGWFICGPHPGSYSHCGSDPGWVSGGLAHPSLCRSTLTHHLIQH